MTVYAPKPSFESKLSTLLHLRARFDFSSKINRSYLSHLSSQRILPDFISELCFETNYASPPCTCDYLGTAHWKRKIPYQPFFLIFYGIKHTSKSVRNLKARKFSFETVERCRHWGVLFHDISISLFQQALSRTLAAAEEYRETLMTKNPPGFIARPEPYVFLRLAYELESPASPLRVDGLSSGAPVTAT